MPVLSRAVTPVRNGGREAAIDSFRVGKGLHTDRLPSRLHAGSIEHSFIFWGGSTVARKLLPI